MSEYLVLRLHPDAGNQASWVVADSGGRHSSRTATGTLEDAARNVGQRPVVVLVPGQQVLLTNIALPVRGTSRMLQAVPFALEEQLADDVRNMHFALGNRDAAGRITVAAVPEDTIENWVQLLSDAGIDAAHMLPDTVGIPGADGIAMVIDGDQCLVRDAQGNTVVCDTESAGAFLTAIGTDDAQDNAILYVSETDARAYSHALSEIRLAVPGISMEQLHDDALPLLASVALGAGQPDLLQGAYAKSGNREKYWQPWRTAAVLAGAFVLTALTVKAIEVMTMKAELRDLNVALNTIASETMPGSKVVDPLLQLEQLAAGLRGASQTGNSGFLQMLDALSGALTSSSNTTLGRLDYRNGTMDLTLTVPDVDTLDRIRRDVAAKGLNSEIQSTNVRDGGVQGRLRISGSQS